MVALPEVTDSYYGSIIVITFALLVVLLRIEGVLLWVVGLVIRRKQYWIIRFKNWSLFVREKILMFEILKFK